MHSDLKQRTNFQFFEGKNPKHLKKHIDLQSQKIYVDKLFFKKILTSLENAASSVQVDILTHNCLKFIYNMIKLH